jgi:hypothetical protein
LTIRFLCHRPPFCGPISALQIFLSAQKPNNQSSFNMANQLPAIDSVPPLLEALRTAPTAPDAKNAANTLAKQIQMLGMTLLR